MNNITSPLTLSPLSILSPLQARMEQLRLSKAPTPLWVLLYIYNYSYVECVSMRADGLWHLIKWLEPIELPTYKPLTTPKLFQSYEMRAVSVWLHTTPAIIHTCMIKEVIPRIERKGSNL